MRILLVSNYIPDRQRSMLLFASLLEEGLTEAGHEVRLVRPGVKAGAMALGGFGLKWLGYIDKLMYFPRELEDAATWADVVHICDQSNAFYVKYIETRPHVVSCHDLLAVRSALGDIPGNRTRWSGRKLQGLILQGLRRAHNIVCVSEATRTDLIRLVEGSPPEISVIYNGLNYPYSPMEPAESQRRLKILGIPSGQPFVLHVGANHWYKNRKGVLRIFKLLRKRHPNRNIKLVMAGAAWNAELRGLVASLGLASDTMELVNVSEEDLRALYSTADAFFFPSLEEGFGWPIAEAQACGCPVVTSNRAPMTEVGADTVTYIDPLDEPGAADALAFVLDNVNNKTREEAIGNAARFHTKAMIDKYVALYTRLLNGHELIALDAANHSFSGAIG